MIVTGITLLTEKMEQVTVSYLKPFKLSYHNMKVTDALETNKNVLLSVNATSDSIEPGTEV